MLHLVPFLFLAFVVHAELDVRILNPIQKASKKVTFQFESDVAELTLKSMKTNADDHVFTNLPLKKSGKVFLLEMEAQKARPGLYKLQVGASGYTKTLHCKLTTSVGIENANIMGVVRKFGSKEDMGKLISASGDKFEVSLSVQDTTTSKEIVPQQMMAHFTHLESGIITLFSFSQKKDRLQLVVDTMKEGKTLKYKSGKYNVALLLADASFEKSLNWNLGTIELFIASTPMKPHSPLYAKPLFHESDTALKVLPEIRHIMRPQDSRPHIVVSMTFTCVVLAPFFGFLLFLSKSEVNLKRFPSGVDALFAVGFILLLGSILGLLLLFWIKLTMFKTLGYLSMLSVATILIGHRALRVSAVENRKIKTKTE